MEAQPSAHRIHVGQYPFPFQRARILKQIRLIPAPLQTKKHYADQSNTGSASLCLRQQRLNERMNFPIQRRRFRQGLTETVRLKIRIPNFEPYPLRLKTRFS
jgi:hypothetical protein